GKTLLWGPIGREGGGVVPEGVETIADGAFKEGRFASVKLPKSLRKIEDGAFYGCEALTEVSIPQNVETVGARFGTAIRSAKSKF
ncbi:MAG: leucine-rich repeat protein, partial [Thermoguttaceae bacterium]|nr:leucine-rich repeat protein [Thermoguttaceae bacterium]